MTPGRLLLVAALIVLIYWAPQWMQRESITRSEGTNPVLNSAQDAQSASAGARKDAAVERMLRDAETYRDSLSAEQRAMVEELKTARGEATKAKAIASLVRTLEQEKKRTLTFYEWAAGVWQSTQEWYDEVQNKAQSWLWGLTIVIVGMGITAAVRSHIPLARWAATIGFGISRGWLVILSFLAVALAMVTRTNPWPTFPLEFILPPLVALVGCSIALRMVDLNYPVWNSLIRGCGAPLISMAFVATFLKLV